MYIVRQVLPVSPVVMLAVGLSTLPSVLKTVMVISYGVNGKRSEIWADVDRPWSSVMVVVPSNRLNRYDWIIPFGSAGEDHSMSTVVAFTKERIGAERPSGSTS